MWIKIIIGLLILSCISSFWDEKIQKQEWKKRKYKLLMALTYFLSAVISVCLAGSIDDTIYLYTVAALVTTIGSILSAINPNLRDMYTYLLMIGAIIAVVTYYFGASHKIIVAVVDLLMLGGLWESWKESISYMRQGLDPDVVAEEKAKANKIKRKVAFRVVKVLARFFG
jgi:uncharacterized membrane protein